MSNKQIYNVLFLTEENADRGIIAEALLNHWGEGKFRAYSAGIHPKPKLHPMAQDVLQKSNLIIENDFYPKSLDTFESHAAPEMDFVIILEDEMDPNDAPEWPGHVITAHWNVEKPSEEAGEASFHRAYMSLQNRIQFFSQLPLERLDHLKRKQEVENLANLQSEESA